MEDYNYKLVTAVLWFESLICNQAARIRAKSLKIWALTSPCPCGGGAGIRCLAVGACFCFWMIFEHLRVSVHGQTGQSPPHPLTLYRQIYRQSLMIEGRTVRSSTCAKIEVEDTIFDFGFSKKVWPFTLFDLRLGIRLMSSIQPICKVMMPTTGPGLST